MNNIILDYLHKKGLAEDDIWNFNGCILNGGELYCNPDSTPDWVTSAKEFLRYKIQVYKNKGIYNGVFIPVYDVYGHNLGVQIRKLSDLEKDKHDSSPMKKGLHLFNLNNAYKSIIQEDKVFITEGTFDTIKLVKEGITNTIAVLGTTLTKDHLVLLLRFTKNIVLILDPDKAGASAVSKITENYVNYANFAFTTMDSDPDEYLHKHGRSALLSTVKCENDILKEALSGKKSKVA